MWILHWGDRLAATNGAIFRLASIVATYARRRVGVMMRVSHALTAIAERRSRNPGHLSPSTCALTCFALPASRQPSEAASRMERHDKSL
jgi:hypothetical protein